MRYVNRPSPRRGVRSFVLCCRLALWAVVAGASVVAVSSRPLGLLSSAWAAAGFVDGFEDMPLMPGLSQDPGSAVSFDSSYGRIIESLASGAVTRDAVFDFYAQTLPQLGWESVKSTKETALYRREGETLSLTVKDKSGTVSVHFQSSPY